MTPDNQITPFPERSRVSIAERLIPSISFGLAAVSGAAGAVMIQQFFSDLRNSESAGRETIFTGMAWIETAVGTGLAVAALIGLIGIVVSIARMFVPTKRASPPGALFLLTGFISLVPVLLIGYTSWLVINAVNNPSAANIGQIGATISTLTWAAIAAAALIAFALAVFSFVPFSSSLGRKYSPLVFLPAVEIAIICLSVTFFLAANGII